MSRDFSLFDPHWAGDWSSEPKKFEPLESYGSVGDSGESNATTDWEGVYGRVVSMAPSELRAHDPSLQIGVVYLRSNLSDSTRHHLASQLIRALKSAACDRVVIPKGNVFLDAMNCDPTNVRPGFQGLISRIQDQGSRLSHVFVESADRLHRDRDNLLRFQTLLDDLGMRLVTANDAGSN